ncbi:MAG: hypothetical protein AAB371_02495 [Patescibacteria group bacterium]
MALRKLKLSNNQLLDLARELKIRFPDSQLKIFKEKRQIILKSKIKLNYFEIKEMELLVKNYYPKHHISIS